MTVCSKGNTPKFSPEWGWGAEKAASAYKSSNISETLQDRTKVTIEVELEVIYALSIGAKINDLG